MVPGANTHSMEETQGKYPSYSHSTGGTLWTAREEHTRGQNGIIMGVTRMADYRVTAVNLELACSLPYNLVYPSLSIYK